MVQKILAVWLFFKINTGISPTKSEIATILRINFYKGADFNRAFSTVAFGILKEEIDKNLYVRDIPEIDFGIEEQLKEMDTFEKTFEKKFGKKVKEIDDNKLTWKPDEINYV